ncbi:MAG TPA: hypothetical protein VKJ01_02150 [Candidatus Solibacter sp.]|nr:hypothetical protein [Candidatus Solibacter sp.]
MAMIEFEDRDEDSRNAILHYMQTGKPPALRGRDLAGPAIAVLVYCAIVILPFLAH